MAYYGGHPAPTCHCWRKYWSVVWDKSMASQDPAQEVQIRHSSDYRHTNSSNYIPIQRCDANLYLPIKYDIGFMHLHNYISTTNINFAIVSPFSELL